MSKNRDEARQYFNDLGLTYDYIMLDDLYYLKDLLNQKFIAEKIRRKKEGGASLYWERVNDAKYFKGVYADGRMINAYLTGKGSYFSAREIISFNTDGYIGFCGEASGCNVTPVIEAFIEWCDYLKEAKHYEN